MVGTVGPNLGLTWGYSPGDSGWGVGGLNPNASLEDAVINLEVTSAALATPPGSPASGDRYIVAGSPTGAWAGHTGSVARYRASAWEFFAPKAGWRAHDLNTATWIYYNGSAWVLERPTRNTGVLLAQWVLGSVVANGVFHFAYKAPYGGTINSLDSVSATGTFTANIKINATSATGLAAVAVTATPTNTLATALRTFVAGDDISGTITLATTSPTDAVLNLNVTWS